MASSAAFTLFLVGAAAALALWTHVRFPGLEPARWRVVILQLVAGMLVINAAVPLVMESVIVVAVPESIVLAAVGVALPGLTYALLTCVWFLRLAQRMLASRMP